jgi:hypothetical protein
MNGKLSNQAWSLARGNQNATQSACPKEPYNIAAGHIHTHFGLEVFFPHGSFHQLLGLGSGLPRPRSPGSCSISRPAWVPAICRSPGGRPASSHTATTCSPATTRTWVWSSGNSCRAWPGLCKGLGRQPLSRCHTSCHLLRSKQKGQHPTAPLRSGVGLPCGQSAPLSGSYLPPRLPDGSLCNRWQERLTPRYLSRASYRPTLRQVTSYARSLPPALSASAPPCNSPSV